MPVLPDEKMNFLYEASLNALILHSPREIYPGPFTYKAFWCRDAALISYALICAGLSGRVETVIDEFFKRQKPSGYFHSQGGEWDSNGQVLWAIQKFCQMTGQSPKEEWKKAILKGARWISKKRIKNKHGLAHNGLFPAGFSAEYLGPNDFYYWDDFWGVQGLHSAAWLARKYGEAGAAKEFEDEAADFMAAIEVSIKNSRCSRKTCGMPSSPYRRLDSGSIGSLAAGYPLRLWPEEDPRLKETIRYLTKRCLVNGLFFQDIAHAGMNPYLSLHLAQNMLRANEPAFWDIVKKVAEAATETGQWPEAIHPQTMGGCMGDGQHAWASAEWMMMIRTMFVREEAEVLILCSGIPEEWMRMGQEFSWGPAPTEFGEVSVRVRQDTHGVTVEWNGRWHDKEPAIEIRLPGYETFIAVPASHSAKVVKK